MTQVATSKFDTSMASREWASRPSDQRFLSLEDLRDNVAARKHQSFTVAQPSDKLMINPSDDGGLVISAFDRAIGRDRQFTPSHWAFGQMCGLAGSAPANWIRKLPAPLAAVNLEYGLREMQEREGVLMLGTDGASVDGPDTLRALTGQSYGRIWDEQVVNAVIKVNESAGGRWVVPSATYSRTAPKRATTLYASDRDVFIFLVDPERIEVGGREISRGFITWNSEVGAEVFGLATFTYDYICDNRIIWGCSNVSELRIRHSRGAPERFLYEGRRSLAQYAGESSARIVNTVEAAQAKSIGKSTDEVVSWLASKGFTSTVAKKAVERAIEEEGGAGTVWQAVQGLTAYARTIEHADARTDVERKAGKLLEAVAP